MSIQFLSARARAWIAASAFGVAVATAGVAQDAPDSRPRDAASNAFLNLLWLTQLAGKADAVEPGRDAQLKESILRTLTRDKDLTLEGAAGFMNSDIFVKFAGQDGRLDPAETRLALDSVSPPSSRRLSPKVVEHLSLLTTSLDMIDERHRIAADELAAWIVENYRPGRPLELIAVCTGNSRRSILTATLLNLAGAYYGMPELRAFSGGTQPTAFNARTIATLREIGVEISPVGKEAAPGQEGTNPIYAVRWGNGTVGSEVETIEYSKRYDAATNPQAGFAALLVCSEADAGCPVVKGASLRLSLPYLDPKIYDGTPFEKQKYAERRDDIGRFALAVVMQARLRLVAAGKIPLPIDKKQ